MEPKGSLLHSQVPTTFPMLSHIDPVHALTSHFLNIHLNIILPSMPGSYKWYLSLRFSHQNPVYTSTLPIHATCPAHIICLNLTTWTIFIEEYRSLSSSLCSFLHSPVTSFLLGPIILLWHRKEVWMFPSIKAHIHFWVCVSSVVSRGFKSYHLWCLCLHTCNMQHYVYN